MAYVQADLDRIDKAIAQGVLSVSFSDGRSVTFSSFAELAARRNFIANQMGVANAGRQRLLGEYKKGVAP
ncbi:MAG: hypothetical protein OEW52_00035 [Thermoleophilia bacterium]|nr:hypothetical protein [Thermoleophilia bacterium]